MIGCDFWIGIWSFVLAPIAVTQWEKQKVGGKVQSEQMWWRFPNVQRAGKPGADSPVYQGKFLMRTPPGCLDTYSGRFCGLLLGNKREQTALRRAAAVKIRFEDK